MIRQYIGAAARRNCAEGEETAFQPAKSPATGPQFLQIVAEPAVARSRKPEPKLTRVAFRVSRLMEFCTKRELQNQTGHSVHQWLLVVLKELMDNALDACEEAEVAPVISIRVSPDSGTIIIQDNAGGIENDTIKSILDYTIRVSSREAYISPTRGAQGNALKTIVAMGYVLDREKVNSDDAVGVTIIETRGIKHRIQFEVDHINLQPRITHDTTPSSLKLGTQITIQWPPNAELFSWAAYYVKGLVESYTWFNPHLTLSGFWNDKEFINVEATNPNWEKWRPRNPTSPHWYDETRLQRYLAAHVARDRDTGRHRTVREFISEFRGLSGTAVQRKILKEVGCSHQSLAQFFGIEKVNRKGIAALLSSLRKHSKPVAPKHLGVIGAEHLKQRFLLAGGNAETFRYEQRKGMTDDGIPYIIEFVFGLHQHGLTQESKVSRKIVTGANWSVGINNPFRAPLDQPGKGWRTRWQR
jgi:DNA topoisomerase VI subunit B